MRLTTLFPGHVPMPLRGVTPVVGVDRIGEADRPQLTQYEADLNFVVRLCSLPGTPFTNRFGFRSWE